ncbi:hypothetical protein ANRL3_01279 [Anaerolineae bacterium]|nr:hypothetical protein ANRL3_01279 [Anaerolineae bacterium]
MGQMFVLKRFTKTRLGKIMWIVLAICVGVVMILYLRVEARAQVDAARRTDTIIVLGSAVWSGERPGPSLAARTRHAIALYKAGYASHLIFSGGLGRFPPSEAEAMRRLATSAGVPADAIVLEDQSHSTEENLANSKALMDAHGWHSALIVSDPFHLLRAETMAHDLGIEAYGSGASDSPSYTQAPWRIWYTTRESVALVWYYGTRVFGEPTWLYGILKGKL